MTDIAYKLAETKREPENIPKGYIPVMVTAEVAPGHWKGVEAGYTRDLCSPRLPDEFLPEILRQNYKKIR